jgi:hypothetical protein
LQMTEHEQARNDGTVQVPDGYQCPLCPCQHSENTFFPSGLVGAPVCQGCTIDLSHYLERDERAQDPLLEALERVTGLSFVECRRRYYREVIELLRRRLQPQYLERELEFEVTHTGRSREQTIMHWQHVIADYETQLHRLESDEA